MDEKEHNLGVSDHVSPLPTMTVEDASVGVAVKPHQPIAAHAELCMLVRFVHDRVREASLSCCERELIGAQVAYSTLDHRAREELHVKIGRLLMQDVNLRHHISIRETDDRGSEVVPPEI